MRWMLLLLLLVAPMLSGRPYVQLGPNDVGVDDLAADTTTVNADSVSITAHGIEAILEKAPNIEEFWIGKCDFEEPGFETLTKYTKLKDLRVGAVGIDLEWLELLKDAPALESLGITKLHKKADISPLVAVGETGKITSLYLEGSVDTDSLMLALISFEKLASLSLAGDYELPAEGWDLLSLKTHLTKAYVGGVSLNPAFMGFLGACSNLASLSIRDCPIDDATLAPLIECKVLTNLWFTGAAWTNENLEALWKIPALQTLRLDKCENLTDPAFQEIGTAPVLEDFSVYNCDSLTDEALKQIGRCATLKSFGFWMLPNVTMRGLSFFQIQLPDCHVSYDNKALAKTSPRKGPERRFLYDGRGDYMEIYYAADAKELRPRASGIYYTQPITLDDLRVHKQTKRLTKIGLTDATDEQLIELGTWDRLVELRLEQSLQVTDRGISALLALNKLEALRLHVGDKVTQAAFADFKKLKALEVLEVNVLQSGQYGYGFESKPTDWGDELLEHLSRCKSLRQLYLPLMPVLTSGAAEWLSKLKKLEAPIDWRRNGD